jgi:hypothetical protein
MLAEARGLERLVPTFDSLTNPAPVLLGHGTVDVVDDGLDRLRDGGAVVALLEPPAVHVADEAVLLLVTAEVLLCGDEVAHAVA